MTGARELNHVQVVPAAPERIRVSVFGGRTQLDIGLPVDVPVSGFVPELARLVSSRDVVSDDEQPGNDERRTFWVLSLFDTGTEIRPDQTLRNAGVVNGQLLRLSTERALPPPVLYDDVVDAAARLNKATHAAWDSRAARWMAFAGTQLTAFALVFCLLRETVAAQHAAVVGLAGAVVVALIGAAAVAHRSYRFDDVAAVLGWAAIPITAGMAWTLLGRHGGYFAATAGALIVVLNVVYYRVAGTGHWGYLASSVPAGLGGIALLATAVGLRVDAVCVALAVLGVLAGLLIPRLTTRLDRFETPTAEPEPERDEYAFENPFDAPASTKTASEDDSGTAMPTAETVWAKVHFATLTRSALLAGLAATVTAAVTVLLRDAPVSWSALTFALACAAVLGLRSRVPESWFERAAVAAPAVALLVITCVLAHDGREPVPVTAVAVLMAVAVVATVAGLADAGAGSHRRVTLLSYLEYLAVAALLPLGLWVLGGYERLGLWR